jgi:conjugative transfer signal peptidase TraF
MSRRRLRALWPVAAALALCASLPLFRLHFFHTESAPLGLWRAMPSATARVGDVARFCMGAEAARLTTGRPYAGGRRGGPCPHDTWTLAKPVIAGPGDTVVHAPGAIWVNGRAEPASATKVADSRGLRVPVAPYGRIVLGAGEYWVQSPFADGSFDSRYVGVVRSSQLRGTLRPVVTWLTAAQRRALRVRGRVPARCGLVACVQPTPSTVVAPPTDSDVD